MSSQKSDERLDNGRIQRVFALMQAEYGSRWVDQTGTGNALKLAVEVWAKKLAGLSDNEIAFGLDNLPEDFPPTPGKFRSICRNKNSGLIHNTAAYKPFDRSRALEMKSDKEKAKQALNKIRQELSGATP